MPELTHAEVTRLIEEVREERRQFEVFMLGYVNGFQDSRADFTFPTSADFEERMKELFKSKMDDSRFASKEADDA